MATESQAHNPFHPESEATRLLFDSLPISVIILQAGQIAYANQATLEMLGYEQLQDLVGQPILDLVAPSQREQMHQFFDSISKQADSVKRNTSMFCRVDGEQIPTEIFVRHLKHLGQTALQVAMIDLSESMQAEISLFKSAELYRRLVELSPNAIFVTDLEGNLLVSNPQAAKMLHFDSVEAMLAADLNAIELIAKADRERLSQKLADLRDGSTLRDEEFILVRPDGSDFPAELSASLLQDTDGRAEAMIGVVRDITERKQGDQKRQELEAQILHAQKLESLGVLAGGIAHDFNNLLMGVLGNASLAMMDLDTESRAGKYVKRIENATLRASELTQQMLAYSGKGRFLIGRLKLDHLVEEMTHLLNTAVSKKITLHYNFSKRLPMIRADLTQVRQVIMNLITNASEAIGDNPGQINISTGVIDVDREYLTSTYLEDDLEPGRYVFFSVQDSGLGMDEQTKNRIFDPFFTTKITGRGLGLAAVMGIIRGHQGAIKVESQVGQGTTFTVLFPAQGQDLYERTDVEEPEKHVFQPQDGLVLVADDEETVRETAKTILARLGFQVITAKDGLQAVAQVRTYADDLSFILLDLNMPLQDGSEALAAMRTIKPDLPVLLSSGFSEQHALSTIREDDLIGFIQKPYTLERMRTKLDEFLPEGGLPRKWRS